MTRWTALTTLSVALLACGHVPEGPPARPELMSMTLVVPRSPAEGEVVWAQVSTGVLPPGARIVVRTLDGAITGAISPYGKAAAEGAGTHTIPLPQEAIVGGAVTLVLGVLEDHAAEVRAPVAGEVEAVELVLVPVTD